MAEMGKKHCQNKCEVLQMVWKQKQQAARKPQPILKSRLETINRLRTVMEKAGKKIREERP